jgi:uncharacterized membrane protein
MGLWVKPSLTQWAAVKCAALSIAAASVELWGSLAYSSISSSDFPYSFAHKRIARRLPQSLNERLPACGDGLPLSNVLAYNTNGERAMNPLNTRTGVVVAGFVLAILIAWFVTGGLSFHPLVFGRWLHIAAGVMWIGLLYYFNFVQVPALAAAAADKGGPGGAGITKYVAPLALLFFRWAALVTWLSGAYYLSSQYGGEGFKNAFMLAPSMRAIGVGAWLGTIMLINVWGPIWQNQKKILGIKPATDEQKAKARRVAFLASRTNTLLSIPMLMCMMWTHGMPF